MSQPFKVLTFRGHVKHIKNDDVQMFTDVLNQDILVTVQAAAEHPPLSVLTFGSFVPGPSNLVSLPSTRCAVIQAMVLHHRPHK